MDESLWGDWLPKAVHKARKIGIRKIRIKLRKYKKKLAHLEKEEREYRIHKMRQEEL